METYKFFKRFRGLFLTLLILIFSLAIIVNSWAGNGIIEHSNPEYIIKDHDAWKSRGRIVGLARSAPDFTFTILTTSKRVVIKSKSERLEDGGRAYEAWLKPGVYILIVAAKGFETLDIHNLEVRAGYDLRIDLEFND